LFRIRGADCDHEFDPIQINKLMRASEFTTEHKTDPSVCRSPKRLGRSDHSSCVSQGLRPHNSKGKGHTDGHGNYLKGKKAKSVRYGGSVKDYS
jgi:hypothetical protein